MTRRKTILILTKILKRVVYPITRLKKLLRNPRSRQFKISLTLLIVALSIAILLLVIWSGSTSDLSLSNNTQTITGSPTTIKKYVMGSPMRHVPLNEMYKVQDDNDTYNMISDHREVYMLDTAGCKIPIAIINYKKYLNNTSKCKDSCGRRALFLQRENENKIRVYVDSHIMDQYLSFSVNYYCCYRSITINRGTLENIEYSVCRTIEHGNVYPLESDFVNVQCFEYYNQNVSQLIYDDFYIFTKKIKIDKTYEKLCNVKKYNVLMIGMNSMSLPRVVQLMPRTVKFFKENFWLGFRGYNKVGDNSLPNLVALLTGQNMSVWHKCSEQMDKCRDLFIWNKFKEDGYVTAFGEDFTSIRNTFNNKFFSFENKSTDHYINPFLLRNSIKSKYKSKLCSGQVPYGEQLLDYAFEFVNTYKQQQFFGVFLMNSYSSDINTCSQECDKMFENFFFRLSYTGSLVNTFVIFLSDHGIRYGDERMKVESYYDERMPFLFIWVPTLFRGSHILKLRYLINNQFRLVTPYDLFQTFTEIKSISTCNNSTSLFSNTNGIRQSIFHAISENRTCDDSGIHMKWCSCHSLYPLPLEDNDGIQIVGVVISLLNSFLKTTRTEKCKVCLRLSLKTIIRIHFYYNNNKGSLFYVVAFTVIPGDMSYEATVSRKGDTFDVIGPVSVISPYKNIGRCALKPRDRMFCVCKNIRNCTSH